MVRNLSGIKYCLVNTNYVLNKLLGRAFVQQKRDKSEEKLVENGKKRAIPLAVVGKRFGRVGWEVLFCELCGQRLRLVGCRSLGFRSS